MKFVPILAGMAFVALALLAGSAGVVQAASADQIRQGEYLARAGDCIACHTVDRNKPFAGGYPLETPLGTIYGPNITPDRETGIGDWSDEEFVRALHEGIGRHGEPLYPAFPYSAFTKMSREDVLAIKAYLFTVPPVRQKTPDNQITFPFNHRGLLKFWRMINFTPGRFTPVPSRSVEWNRGAYLTEALAHCQECHTPRNMTMGLDRKRPFGGGMVAGWLAFNITSDPVSGVGGWTSSELVQYLRSGIVAGKGSAAGGMAEVVENSLRYLSIDDVKAMVTYVGSVPAIRDEADQKARTDWGEPSQKDASLRGVAGVTISSVPSGGIELYSGHCASCHAADGSGVRDGTYPALFHNSVVGARDPSNLVMVILHGVERRSEDRHAFMAGFADPMDDAEVAMLANHLTKQYGNPRTMVDTRFVAMQRHGGPPSPLPRLLQWGAAAAALLVLLLLLLLWRSRGRRAVRH
jgi:mono/diheme cytochrome c family protein